MKITFSYLVASFFTAYLKSELGLSPNTIASYSDCMRLLLNHVCSRLNIACEAIDVQMITPELILEFLNALERDRQNGPATRNQRLAAIKTFFHFLAKTAPELMHHSERVQAIHAKRIDHPPPPSLTLEEVTAIVTAPDPNTTIGVRDRALLQLLYNTGARVQELADLSVANLRLDSLPAVTLTGKGRRTRVVPLWSNTVDMIQQYLASRKPHLHVSGGECRTQTQGIGEGPASRRRQTDGVPQMEAAGSAGLPPALFPERTLCCVINLAAAARGPCHPKKPRHSLSRCH